MKNDQNGDRHSQPAGHACESLASASVLAIEFARSCEGAAQYDAGGTAVNGALDNIDLRH